MQTGSPFARYRKTIIAKVYVTVISPFSGQPEGLILFGDPTTDAESCYIDVWTEMEDVFFQRKNKEVLATGRVVRTVLNGKKEVAKPIETYSDEELREVLGYKYLSFQKTLSEITSAATVQRLLDLAKEAEKSDKIIATIEAKLSELQVGE
jgi:hypothetical protein